MAQYNYRAVNASGSVVNGRLEAVHQQDLMAQLGRLGLSLVRAREARERKARGSSTISRRDLILMVFHLEMMSRAGVPIPTAIADLRDSSESPALRELTASLHERINNGENVAQAMSAFPKAFSPSTINLIRAGEQSGDLAHVLGELLRSLKWQDETAAKTKKMMMYPAFVGSVILIVVFFLMIYLVPQMVSFIKNMNRELPLHTKALIATSGFVKNYWWALLVTPPSLWFATGLAMKRNARLRRTLHRLALRVPLVGPIVEKIILARVLDTLSLMYAAGVPMLEALKQCAMATTNMVIHEGVVNVQRRVSEGIGLTQAFTEQGLFPPLVIRMMRVGESTGRLDEALRNVSYFFNRDIDEGISRIEAAIEPAMTVVLGLLLGWIMLSVLGPIYDIISTLKI